jgi:Tfp pilus assembly protein PilX
MIDMRHLANLERRLAAEGGFALLIAMFVMLIISVLVAAAITVASQTSTSTTRDTNTKAALEAAEAGLQVAAFRLSKLEPTETACITGTTTAFPTLPTTGEHIYCEDVTKEPLGSGATFQYWTSRALKAGTACGGTTAAAEQRCITSEGIANGVSPGTRLQALVKKSTGESLFTVKGIIGLEELKISGSVKLPSVVASNGKIIGLGGGAFERGFELCPEKPATFTPSLAERGSWGGSIGEKGETTDPAVEKTRTAGAPECPLKAPLPTTHAASAANEDSRITKGEDPMTGTAEFNTVNDELTLGANAKLTLHGSKYYFCSITTKSTPELIIPTGVKAEIFIGSHEEGFCPTGSGTIKTEKGEFVVTTEEKNPAALLIVMAGKGPIAITNGSKLEASIYAPEAEVIIKGGSGFRGGIVGNIVHIENGTGVIEWSEELKKLTNGVAGAYERKSWEQCTPGSGASEGC